MLLALALAACLTPEVTLTMPAAPVANVVKEVARLTEMPLYTDGSVAGDIVCLNVREVPLDALKTKLAEAIGATWVDRDGNQVLTRPDWLDKQQRDEALDAKVKEIEKALSARPKLPSFDSGTVAGIVGQVNAALADMNENIIDETHDKARRSEWAALEKTPVHRLLEKIVRKLDTRQFAAIPPSYQVCFSNEPNASEKRLPFDLRPMLAEYRDEQRLLQRTLQSKDTAKWNKVDDRRYYYYDADPECRRVLLIVSKDRQRKMPTFRLCVLDGEGWISGTAILTLSPPPSERDISAPEPEGDKIEFSETSRGWSKALEQLYQPFPSEEPLKPWLPRLLNPERDDPLSLPASEALIQYSKIKGRPLIALVPDRALTWPGSAQTTMSLGTFAGSVRDRWRARIDAQDGWLLVRPKLFSEARDERIERAALGTFFRQIRGQNRVGVDDAATYVVNSRSDLVFETYDQAAPGLAEPFQGEFEPRQLTLWYYRALLRFLGTLSPVQRHSLLGGAPLTLSQTGPAGKAALEQLLYSRDMIERLFKKVDVFDDDPKKIRGRATDEVWERLPNGIPGTTLIRCKPEEQSVIFAEEGDDHLMLCWSPEGFGMNLAEETGELGQDLPTMRLGQGVTYEFRFEFTPDVVGTATIREVIPGKRTLYKRLEDFPAAIQDQIKQGYNAERERLAKRRSEGRGTTPPP